MIGLFISQMVFLPLGIQQSQAQNITFANVNNTNPSDVQPSTNRTNGSMSLINQNLISKSDTILSNNQSHAHIPVIYTSENEIFVLWEQTMPQGGSDIFFTKSKDHGVSFDEVINLSNDTGDSINPKIATSGENVYVGWGNVFPNGTGQVLLRASLDKGNTFGNPVDVSQQNLGESSDRPQLAASGQHVYLVWENTQASNSEIYFSRSLNNGQNFTTPVTISNTTGSSVSPKIIADDANVYVIWEDNSFGDYDILLTKSTDNGATFIGRINLSNTGGNSLDSNIEVIGGNVYVVWKDFLADNSENSEILFTKSIDNGQTFDDAKIISKTPGSSQHPIVTGFNNYVFVVWQDTTDGNSDIYFARSVDEGDSFQEVENLSYNEGESTSPTIGIDERTGGVNIVWADSSTFTGEPEIFYIRSETAGATFDVEHNISDTPLGDSVQPALATSRSDVYIVWEDDITGEGWTTNIFFSIVE